MSSSLSELMRIDPLTERKNYLGFLEILAVSSSVDLLNPNPVWGKDAGSSWATLYRSHINASVFSAVLFVELNQLRSLNEAKGWSYGDSVIRWLGILLEEECKTEVYRVGGVEFAVLLKLETREEHDQLLEHILARVRREASLLGFPDPGSAADLALVLFDQAPTSVITIPIIMAEAMTKVKNYSDACFKIFHVTDFSWQMQAPNWWKSENESDLSFAPRWIALVNIYQVLQLGSTLDRTQQEAYTDLISGLPNLKAALLNMEQVVKSAAEDHRTFALLMIDGDNIRAYNSVNYAAGDDMIREMSTVIRESIRPNDFVARWRTGDEFMVILPDTSAERAKNIGERIRLSVKEASKKWLFPTTISIGIACFPVHGSNINSLVNKAEAANKCAKEKGKDRVVLAE